MISHTAAASPLAGHDFLIHQRGELAGRRAASRDQLERLSVAVEGLARSSGSPIAVDDQGLAEADPVTVERDRVLSLSRRAQKCIDDIDAAIRRLESGTYGACRTCRQPVPAARLEAVPEASQCVPCASGAARRRR